MIDHDELDKHIGDVYARFDIGCGGSPGLEVILPAGTDATTTAALLKERIIAAVTEVVGPNFQWGLGEIRVEGNGHVILDRQSRIDEMHRTLDALHDSFSQAREVADREIAANPDNGKYGYWRVEGLRHETTVSANGEAEAIAKAIETGDVGDWEWPRARYVGTEI